MGNKFKRSTTVSGKFQGVVIDNNTIIDAETGEEINIIAILSDVYGSQPFDISTTLKTDMELTPDGQ